MFFLFLWFHDLLHRLSFIVYHLSLAAQFTTLALPHAHGYITVDAFVVHSVLHFQRQLLCLFSFRHGWWGIPIQMAMLYMHVASPTSLHIDHIHTLASSYFWDKEGIFSRVAALDPASAAAFAPAAFAPAAFGTAAACGAAGCGAAGCGAAGCGAAGCGAAAWGALPHAGITLIV